MVNTQPMWFIRLRRQWTLADGHRRRGRKDHAAAEAAYRRALALDERALGAEHPDVAEDLSLLGALLADAGRAAEAEAAYRRALAVLEKALGPEHPETAGALTRIAALCDAGQRRDEAEGLLRRALAVREKASARRKIGRAHV